MVKAIEHNALAAVGTVHHGFFTRGGGVSSGIYASLNCGYGSNDDADAVRKRCEGWADRVSLVAPYRAEPAAWADVVRALARGA